MTHEDWRYNAGQGQITQLLDEATLDKNPATAILRSLLLAEMYDRNERSHQRAIEARTGIVQALQWRIQQKRDVPVRDDLFLDYDIDCPVNEDGEHDFHLVAVVDGCEIYECECGLIDC